MPKVDIYYTFFIEDIRLGKEMLLAMPFSDGHSEYILPIECDQALNISNEIEAIFTEMAQKLKTIDKLKMLSNMNYNKLLMHLYSANEKLNRLNELLTQFRPICMKTTKRQHKILGVIHKETLMLIQLCEKIEVETKALIDSISLENTSIYPTNKLS